MKITVQGIVQGVGFRPFVYRLANELDIKGSVRNTTEGVIIEAEGNNLEIFIARLQQEKPPNAVILSMRQEAQAAVQHVKFQILPSEGTRKETLLAADLATCADCLAEINDPANRRYRYPFTNCTNCGPRYSIVEELPYDRANTTMKAFKMCTACKEEYEDPADRRFHAQPNACPKCGPQIIFEGESRSRGEQALQDAATAIHEGKIAAVKGVGGFHLIVDATNKDSVIELRRRKHREAKPLAILFPDIETIRKHCSITPAEEELLSSPAAPIVLLTRRTEELSHVSPGSPLIGAFLPYSPLHHLLLKEVGRPVVATSGNSTDEPICIDNEEALRRLSSIADCFLLHDRPIARQVDDSVVRFINGQPTLLRASRGYAPRSFPFPEGPSLLATGAQMKNTVAITAGSNAILSQHIGDLDHAEAFAAFEHAIGDFASLYGAVSQHIAHDKHPAYSSTQYAKDSGRQTTPVQHHYAHALSCMIDNELHPPVLAVTWDGTGYGDDSTIWGGEFLKIDDSSYERFATFRQFRLPGGESAIRNTNRIAYSLLHEIGEEYSIPERGVIRAMLEKRISTPITTSAGRLFDGVAAMIGVCNHARFEGEAAMLLEYSIQATDERYAMLIHGEQPIIIDWEPMLRSIRKDINEGTPVGIIAGKFHNTMVDSIVEVAKAASIKKVCLSGGCFQNKYLAERTVAELRRHGFTPYTHRRVPPNDGGIALGQLAAVRRCA